MKPAASDRTKDSPFHAGEQAVQSRLGVREQIEPWARRVVRDHLPEEHREFYAALPFVVAAARDRRGLPWVTLLTGEPDFIQSRDERSLDIDGAPTRGDALENALVAGADVGLLGIELASRRRNRVNGRLVARTGDGLRLGVEQSFGNCPQYIHERAWRRAPADVSSQARRGDELSTAQQQWITGADTFFIASGHRGDGEHAGFGMDASHRGGEPGFVRVHGPRRLSFPDYAGNNHYNTIGNLVLDARAGLLFVDFEAGSLLQLTGRASIEWTPSPADATAGVRRVVSFDMDEVVELAAALPLRWQTLAPARPLHVVERVRESADVTSFWLQAADDQPLADYEPGQHLPVELEMTPPHGRLRRTYSLSAAPGTGRYRITVKREPHGVASRALHDSLQAGDLLLARPPAGDFVLRPGTRPVVLISAGVGVTPMAAMLQTLVQGGDPRPLHFIHVARDGDHHALAHEVRELAARGHDASFRVLYSRPQASDVLGRDYDKAGRLDAAQVIAWLPDLDADFYLCGPRAFMADIEQGLSAAGVPVKRLHSESFGPAG